jgi:prepilin-type processing-associated H-X9-DG protein
MCVVCNETRCRDEKGFHRKPANAVRFYTRGDAGHPRRALLLPALARARSAANGVVCENNLHEIYVACQSWRRAKDTIPLSAGAWVGETLAFIKTTRMYVCPEGGMGSGTGLFIHVRNINWDVPLEEGPYVQKTNQSGSSYELRLDDDPNGDRDFNDLVVRVDTDGDGVTHVTILSKSASYTFDLTDGNGNVVLPQPGDPGPGAPGTTITYGGSSSYAMNQQVQKIFGKADKVLLLDYTSKLVADAAADRVLWQPTAGHPLPLFARHSQWINVCYGDGSVRPTLPGEINISTLPVVRARWEP